MLQPLDGPSAQATIPVTDSTVLLVKAGAQPLDERKVVTLQADGKLLVYFGDSDAAAPSAATVQSSGILVAKNGIISFEAAISQPLYMLSNDGSINVKVIERA